MTFEIVHLRPTDTEPLYQMGQRTLGVINYNLELWQKLVTSFGQESWKIVYQQQTIGTLIARDGYIVLLMIDVVYQHQGWGKVLLDHFLAHYQGTETSLHCHVHNRVAQHLYHSRGFQIQTLVPNYYHFPNQTCQDAYFMIRKVVS